MADRRTYGQLCGLATALDVLGERWTLLVVRELLGGPARFSEIIANLPGIGANQLSARLRTLVGAGVVEQVHGDPDGRVRTYRLTASGERLRRPVLGLAVWGLGRVGTEQAGTEHGGEVRASWAALALEAMVLGRDGARAPAAVAESYEFRIGPETMHLRAGDGGEVRVVRGPAPEPSLVVRTDPKTFALVGARRLDPLDGIVEGRLDLTGSPEALQRCLHLIGLTDQVTG